MSGQFGVFGSCTAGKSCSLSNTVCGLTSYTTPASATLQDMNYDASICPAMLQFNETGYARPQNNATDQIAVASGDVMEIKLAGTSATFYKNAVLFATRTVASGTYYPYISADNNPRVAGGTFTFS